MIGEMNKALRFLCAKYGVREGEMVDLEGTMKVRLPDGTEALLLPWRTERRFIELKNLIGNRTLEEVSTLRFASMTAGIWGNSSGRNWIWRSGFWNGRSVRCLRCARRTVPRRM